MFIRLSLWCLLVGSMLWLAQYVPTYAMHLWHDQNLQQLDKQHIAAASQAKVRDLSGDAVVAKFLQEHAIYLSMSSTVGRADNLKQLLPTLATEYLREILIVLPPYNLQSLQVYDREKHKQQLTDNHKVKILYAENDWGPVTKLLPAYHYVRNRHAKSVLIVIDDDHIYPQGMINEHIYALAHHPGHVSTLLPATLGKQTARMPAHYQLSIAANVSSMWSRQKPWMVHGAGSIGMRSEDIDISWLQQILLNKSTAHCRWSDDLLISLALAKKGVKPILLHSQYASIALVDPYMKNSRIGGLMNTTLAQDTAARSIAAGLSRTASRLQYCVDALAGQLG